MPAIIPDACGACRVQTAESKGPVRLAPTDHGDLLVRPNSKRKNVRSISGACVAWDREEKVSRGLFLVDPRERGTVQKCNVQHAAQIRRKMRSAQPVHERALHFEFVLSVWVG